MKQIQRSTVVLVAFLALIALAAEPAAADRWTPLGAKHVADRLDRDVLHLEARKGTFDSIRLKVRGRAVQFHGLEIHFENGTKQKVALRTVIRPGKFSRVIDLDGGQRAIEKIVFLYDAQTPRRGKGAQIRVFGRR